jgi:hypothetical protein
MAEDRILDQQVARASRRIRYSSSQRATRMDRAQQSFTVCGLADQDLHLVAD